MEKIEVSQEYLRHMANVFKKAAEDIKTLKSQMDSALNGFYWEDPVGIRFKNRQYPEGFKPLQSELIPQLNDFIKHLVQLNACVSGYAGVATIEGASLGFYGEERNSSNARAKQTEIKSSKMPKLKTEEKACLFPHTAKEYYDKWAYVTDQNGNPKLDKNGNRVFKRYPIGLDGKELTAENYRDFDKRTLMRSLSYGMGFNYEEKDMGELIVKDGKVYGHKGKWIGDNEMIVNKRLFSDKNISHENVLEIVFHENQHIIQGKQLSINCLTDVPEDGGRLSPECVNELNEKGYYKAGDSCQKEYDDYLNHWTEVEAREEGEKGRKIAKRNYMINKYLFKDL